MLGHPCWWAAYSVDRLQLSLGVRRTSAPDGYIFQLAAAPVPLRRPSQRVRLPRRKGAAELMSGVQIPGGHFKLSRLLPPEQQHGTECVAGRIRERLPPNETLQSTSARAKEAIAVEW